WIKTFPDEFFEQIYRLQGWEYKPGTSQRVPYVGKLVNKYVYEQLPPGVLDELRRRNPRVDGGYRRHKFHQLLTADTGNPHLDKQISTVTTLMRISEGVSDFILGACSSWPMAGGRAGARGG
ncbi:MAG: P63C domain-containing protein, partial [Bryobacteraceae bacterium]